MVGRANHSKECTFAKSESIEHFGSLGRIGDGGGLSFELDAHSDDLNVVASIVERFCDSTLGVWNVVEFIFADVDDCKHSTVREQKVRVEGFSYCRGEPGSVERTTVGEGIVCGAQRLEFVSEALIEFRSTFDIGESLFDSFKIGERELEFYDT